MRASADGMGAAAIAGVVDRPRLYQVLDSQLVRVCIVQGPSGSGKTTLLRSWVLQQDEPATVAWISLSAGITSRQIFWQHVVVSAERLGEMSSETAIRAREQLSVAVDPVRIASAILAAAGPVVLILDAYEHLGEVGTAIDQDLARLVIAVPGLRVMITTRSPTALAELTLPEGVVRTVTLTELALTPDEVGALIAEQAGIEDERLASSVAAATQGFALTVRAVVLALSQLGRIPRPDSREWNAVAAAKLEGLLPDAAAVQFVTDTSVPPYVDVGLAELLSENADAAGMLGMLERNGFGRWIPYARNRPVFQYVETIRDTFRDRAVVDSERFRRSCTVTALWLLENEEVVDQALQFAIEAGDYALADRVFVSLVISNPDSYTTDRFLPVLRKVPDAALHEYPMLAFGLGLALMANPILRLEAPRVFQVAVESPAQPPYLEPSIDAFAHASMRAISRRLALQFPASADASRAAARLVDTMEPGLLSRFGEHVGTILRQLSFSIWLGGFVDEAIATANRSTVVCTTPAVRNYSIVYSAAMNAFAGDIVRAGEIAASVDGDAWPAETRATSMNSMGVLAEAYVRLDALDFAGAAEVLRTSGANMRTSEYWPFLTAAGVSTRHGLGHARAEAERVTAELTGAVLPPGVGDNVATEQLNAALALAWISAGNNRAAARILARQPQDSPYLAGARVAWLLSDRRDGQALKQAAAALELPGHTIRTRVETQTLAAVAALRQSDPELAWSWLSSAAMAWETHGTRMHVALLEPRDRRRLWEFAHERGSLALQRYFQVPALDAHRSGAMVELTEREQVVLSAVAEYGSTREVAEVLVVSPYTIKAQLRSIYRKLGVSSRQAACEVARELGLLDHAGRRSPRAE